MRRWQWWAAALACATFIWVTSARVSAETVTVTIGVGDTILTVMGRTSPNAFVTISDGPGVIGTMTAASDGTYTKTFPAQTPGLHDISVYAHTPSNENTDTVTVNMNIAEHSTTTADIFLPPTVTVVDSTLDQGQPLAISGQTYPLSSVKVFIDSSEYFTASADTSGDWSASIDTASLAAGQHQFFVKAIDGIGNQSSATVAHTFTLPQPPAANQPNGKSTPDKPTITFPTPGLIWIEPQITVTGTAQPNVQIELWDGDTALGSVWSDANGEWRIPLALQLKDYNLRVRACLDNVCSDFQQSTPFVFTPKDDTGSWQKVLLLHLPVTSFTVNRSAALTLRATVLNGKPPYSTNIDWGDGESNTVAQAHDELVFSHIYNQPGMYAVTVYAKDALGYAATAHVSVNVVAADHTYIVIAVSLLVGGLPLVGFLVWLRYYRRRIM